LIAVLSAAVVLVGVLVVVDLLLSFGLIRRLRVVQARGREQATRLPEVGRHLGPFEARTLDGGTISEQDLADGMTVALFLAAGCPPCERFKAELLDRPFEAPTVVFVRETEITADTVATVEIAEELSEIGATVSIIEPESPVIAAFGIYGYPTAVLVWNGSVVAAGNDRTPLDAGLAEAVVG
jgi:thiol-disulfide isomerase/thioredoxin